MSFALLLLGQVDAVTEIARPLRDDPLVYMLFVLTSIAIVYLVRELKQAANDKQDLNEYIRESERETLKTLQALETAFDHQRREVKSETDQIKQMLRDIDNALG